MAQFYADFWGPKLELDSPETQALATAEDVAGAIATMGAVAPPPADVVLGAIAAYIGLQRSLVQAVDRGNGIWLTLPWPAIWWGQWWLLVPTPR
jgi:hypothetical protein